MADGETAWGRPQGHRGAPRASALRDPGAQRPQTPRGQHLRTKNLGQRCRGFQHRAHMGARAVHSGTSRRHTVLSPGWRGPATTAAHGVTSD